MKEKLKAIWRILRAKEYFYAVNNGNGYKCEWVFTNSLPKRAKSEEYADLVMKKSARLCAMLKKAGTKVFCAYNHCQEHDPIITEIEIRSELVARNVKTLMWDDGEVVELKFNENKSLKDLQN